MSQSSQNPDVHIHASTFQLPLGKLAEVLAQKVKREAPVPGVVRVDLHVLVRQAMWTYNLRFYLNADERRKTDCNWRDAYTIVTLPLVRNMIDCLYNVTAILEHPVVNGPWFRKSGFKKLQTAIEEDEKRYSGRPDWDLWNSRSRVALDLGVRTSGFRMADVLAANEWPTLGRYTKMPQKGGTFTPHQQFLRTFLYGHWRQYSAMAHATFEGLSSIALYYTEDSIPADERPKLDDAHAQIMSTHLARAAVVLLCIVTELQAKFGFDDNGANINKRLHEMWNALMPVFDVKELYDERYMPLMKDKGINP